MTYGNTTYGSIEYGATRVVTVAPPPVPVPKVVQAAGVPKNYVWKTKIRRVVLDSNGRRTTVEEEMQQTRAHLERYPKGTLHKALAIPDNQPLDHATLRAASFRSDEIGERARHVRWLKRLTNQGL